MKILNPKRIFVLPLFLAQLGRYLEICDFYLSSKCSNWLSISIFYCTSHGLVAKIVEKITCASFQGSFEFDSWLSHRWYDLALMQPFCFQASNQESLIRAKSVLSKEAFHWSIHTLLSSYYYSSWLKKEGKCHTSFPIRQL